MKGSKSLLNLGLAVACAASTLSLAMCAQAQTLNYFADFNGGNGWEPYASVTQATDGNFYGAATNGIEGGGGNIFRMTPSGEITSVYKFCSQPNCVDGAQAQSAPVLGSDGNLYGVTTGGGTTGSGVFYQLADGKYKVLYSLCPKRPCDEGQTPNGIILASDGNFYGTTVYGGAGGDGPGTIFKVTPSGTYTQLYSFCAEAGCADGEKPFFPPVEGNDGNFYGAATTGGKLGGGVIYKLTPSGTYSVIYNFCGNQNRPAPTALIRGYRQRRRGQFCGQRRRSLQDHTERSVHRPIPLWPRIVQPRIGRDAIDAS